MTELAGGDPCVACIEHMAALAGELRCAMEAIGANAEHLFAASVGRQQLIVSDWEQALGEAGRAAATPDQKWRSRLDETARELGRLHGEYAALIEHSGRSVRMLLSLTENVEANRKRWLANA